MGNIDQSVVDIDDNTHGIGNTSKKTAFVIKMGLTV